ncbi:LuxR C-terminal-related transcriptional regulator [Variovorax sp. VNK109]|uniref:LuxR C-terminal-related transcriptional regulator n=1 Tax=Variovorax sp. VNK109 TaxID=3400919 RepID=UPI003C0DF5ED
MQTSIYLIEDDTTVHDFVLRTLQARPEWKLAGYSASFAHAAENAADAAASVYLVDLGLPDGHGEDLLKMLSVSNPGCELLVFTVFGDETRLINAIEAGATGYVLKGCSGEELISAIEQIQEGGAPISSLLARLLLKRLRSVQDSLPPVRADALSSEVILSERETDVLKLVAQGYVNKEIARKLDISGHTVGSHIKNLYRKLAVHTRVQVVRAAQERGLV